MYYIHIGILARRLFTCETLRTPSACGRRQPAGIHYSLTSLASPSPNDSPAVTKPAVKRTGLTPCFLVGAMEKFLLHGADKKNKLKTLNLLTMALSTAISYLAAAPSRALDINDQVQADLPDDRLAAGVECPNYMDHSGGQRGASSTTFRRAVIILSSARPGGVGWVHVSIFPE